MQRHSTTAADGSSTGRQLARDKVFAVAADLFYRKGIHAVGVEEIVKEAGVAKISLYRNFASKDDLVIAYLDDRRISFLREWDAMFDRYSDDPRTQLRAIMTYVAKRTSEEGYRGCPFINFSAEFPDPSHPGRVIGRATMQAVRERFLRLAEALGVPEPKRLADGLLLLFEGAYGLSQTLGGGKDSAMHQIVWASEMLVEAQFAATNPKGSKLKRSALAKRR
jgi:AcrR family transcriptional regulator